MNNLTIEQWAGMSLTERETYSRHLANALPGNFRFREILLHSLGSLEHDVAIFDYQNASFALVPGGMVTIGYDSTRLWEPTQEELESWRTTSEEYGIDSSIHDYIRAVTFEPRRADVASMLVEITPTELGWESIDPNAPEARDMVRQCMPNLGKFSQVGLKGEGYSFRMRRSTAGIITAELCRHPTHEQVSRALAETGFRLPSSDEWEFICGMGAGTLFRWGDHAPCDRYPSGSGPMEAESHPDSLDSANPPGVAPDTFESGWNLHQRPNAFGIHIAGDPYKSELVTEPHLTRGGDGGSTICGGAGFFVGWLTLATAYFEQHACVREPQEPIDPEFTIGRRVLPIN